MASTTKGSIKISTANEIGTALVDKLGGEGYAPETWSDNINLCGIAEADKEAALSVLSDSAGTGNEKGSILLATANKIGAMLNKKYYTDRGFKPKEWASAISKTKALTEGTASGTIANIQNGADKVPLTSWEIAIGANLDGINEVGCNEAGKNFASGIEDYNVTNKIIPPVFLKSGTYTFSCERGVVIPAIYIRKGEVVNISGDAYAYRYNATSYTFVADVDGYYFIQLYRTGASSTWEDYPVTSAQIEVGSSASAYAPYTAPTTQTVELGRTIYGGTVDVVKGTGEDENGNEFTFPPLSPIPKTEKIRNYWSEAGASSVGYYEEPTPYTRGTATGAVANFDDARTDLPCTKVIANVAPSIAGKSVINMKRAGKNLFDGFTKGKGINASTGAITDNANGAISGNIRIGAGVDYAVSGLTSTIHSFVAYYKIDDTFISRTSGNNKTNLTATTPSECAYLIVYQYYSNDSGTIDDVDNLNTQVEIGSSATAFEPYEAPTNYEANLDEALHGGSVDFVSGEVVKEYGKIVFDGSESQTWTMITVTQGTMFRLTIADKTTTTPTNSLCSYYTPENQAQRADGTISGAGTNADIIDNRFSSADAFKEWLSENPVTFVYELATPTESNIAGQVISPKSGVNNFWNDAGGDTEIEYFEEE